MKGSYYYPDSAGEGVNVYVVDTGVKAEHPDFEGRVTWGIETIRKGVHGFYNGSHADDGGHGTHVAGTIAGKISGVAKKVNIISVKVFDWAVYGDAISITMGLYVFSQL